MPILLVLMGLLLAVAVYFYLQWSKATQAKQGLETENAVLNEKVTHMQAQIDEQPKMMEQFLDKQKVDLSNWVKDWIQHEGSERSQNHLKELGLILNPLQDHIKEFKGRVDSYYRDEKVEKAKLQAEVEKLIQAHGQTTLETQKLTEALKGSQKSQGAWGELVLENILEQSGLKPGEDFFPQSKTLGLKSE